MFMPSLIEELKELSRGVEAYDEYSKVNFNLRAAYLWSVHDLPAYGIWAGWCVHGWLCCLVCMANSDAFWLSHSSKFSFFDCHRRFLPPNHPFRQLSNAS